MVFGQERPNIIYIMSDDHDADAISAYQSVFIHTPNIDRLAFEGIRCTQAFVGNSICAPARATLLTGQHAHAHGVKDNRTRFDSSRLTLPKLFQAAGYQTAIVGKWHLHSLPAGFNYWKILPGQGQYFNTRMIEMTNDTIQTYGYATDVITEEALRWLKERDTSKPFLLFVHHLAPHRYFFPDLKHLEHFHTRRFPEPPTLYADTTGRGAAWKIQTMSLLNDMRLCSDLKVDPDSLMDLPQYKPDSAEVAYYKAIFNRVPETLRQRYKEIYALRGKLLREQKPLGKELLKIKYQWYMQDYLACVASLDENTGKLLTYLDENNLTPRTLVIYTSDQGFYLGENGWFDKRFAYDVSMQTPFLIRWPGHIARGRVFNQQIQNIDWAPTLLHVAGIKKPAEMHGLSLKPFFMGKRKKLKRKYIYYRYYEFGKDHTVIPHVALRSPNHKLIYFYTVNEWELYDLKADPYEQHNLIQSPVHKKIFLKLKRHLLRLRKHYQDTEPAGTLK
ncbi:MAG: sulfatase [Chitinophagaceae bacterium]|nr:sulfatase [Chitinophagaceae bacterium]